MACPSVPNTRTVFSSWLVLLGLCALIFIQSHGLVLTNIPLPMNLDKVLHFFCFAVLAVLFFRAYHALSLRPSVKFIVFVSAISAIIFGIGDEFHQSFIPLRVADGYDILADAAGALFGLVFYVLWCRRGGRSIFPSTAKQCI